MKTSWKHLGRSLLLITQWKNGQQSLRGGERALRNMDGLATPKMPSLMKLSRSYTPWLCVIGVHVCVCILRSIASEVDNTMDPNRHLRYVKGFGKMGAEKVDQRSDKDSALYLYLLSRYEDDPGDFIEQVVTQNETWVHHFD